MFIVVMEYNKGEAMYNNQQPPTPPPGLSKVVVSLGVTRFFFTHEWKKHQIKVKGLYPLFPCFADDHPGVAFMHVLWKKFSPEAYTYLSTTEKLFRVNGHSYTNKPRDASFLEPDEL